MKINFKRNGGKYISGCTISFGSKEMRDLKIISENNDLKKIKSAENTDGDTLVIKFEKN